MSRLCLDLLGGSLKPRNGKLQPLLPLFRREYSRYNAVINYYARPHPLERGFHLVHSIDRHGQVILHQQQARGEAIQVRFLLLELAAEQLLPQTRRFRHVVVSCFCLDGELRQQVLGRVKMPARLPKIRQQLLGLVLQPTLRIAEDLGVVCRELAILVGPFDELARLAQVKSDLGEERRRVQLHPRKLPGHLLHLPLEPARRLCELPRLHAGHLEVKIVLQVVDDDLHVPRVLVQLDGGDRVDAPRDGLGDGDGFVGHVHDGGDRNRPRAEVDPRNAVQVRPQREVADGRVVHRLCDDHLSNREEQRRTQDPAGCSERAEGRREVCQGDHGAGPAAGRNLALERGTRASKIASE
ncbi:hypothetical protein DFJ74DRAFT_692361 [Hyaloraphidium curvatum]|nr:hypothetical protein DFJ74DRAFT_692361 [Hyaloraphidium curvatum]